MWGGGGCGKKGAKRGGKKGFPFWSCVFFFHHTHTQKYSLSLSLNQSSQLFSTVSRTRFVYSLRLSLYRFEASTLAGEEVLGSLSRLGRKRTKKSAWHEDLLEVPSTVCGCLK